MDINKIIRENFGYLDSNLQSEIEQHAILKMIPSDTEILKIGQYVKVIPLVIEGVIKVSTSYEDKELLLYYIQPQESCIMSFSAGLNQVPSKVFAQTEEDTTALLLPTEKVTRWTTQYPNINMLFFQQYNKRYSELLDTINHLIYEKLDVRLLNYLQEKKSILNQNPIKISHRQIASELGTAREVISRTLKKLEKENKVIISTESIKVI